MNICRTSAFLAVALTAGAIAQEKPKIDATLDVDISSKYVWRGVNFVNDWVLQPSVAFSSSGFKFSVWGNMELTGWNSGVYPKSPKNRFTEFDTSLEYRGAHGKGDWWLGYVDYQFPGTGAARFQEWYGGVSLDQSWGAPALTVYKGANANVGTYLTLGVTRSVKTGLTGKMSTCDLCALIGYGDKKGNNFLYGSNKAGFTDLNLSATTSFEIGKGWTFTPSVNYSTLLEKSLRAGLPRRSNIWLNFGFTRNFAF